MPTTLQRPRTPTPTPKKPAKEQAPKEAIPKAPDEPIVLGIVPRGDLLEVELDLIDDPPGQPDRLERPNDDVEIAETARSMREVGQLQPVMVEMTKDADRFIRVFGRRRIAAARLNKAKTILAIVVGELAPDVRRTIVAVENIQRKNLSAAEEHLAVAELLELQAFPAGIQVGVSMPLGPHVGKKLTVEISENLHKAHQDAPHQIQLYQLELLQDPKVRARAAEIVAAMLAKSRSWVNERLYVGRLGPKGRQLVLSGKLPLVHAAKICRVADPAIREDMAVGYAAGGPESRSDHEAGDLIDLEKEVSQRLFNLKVVPWKLELAFADKPACEGCPSNSATNPGLFEGGGTVSDTMVRGIGRSGYRSKPADIEKAVCTDHRCYAVKLRCAKSAVAAAAKRIVDDGRDPKKDPKVVQPFVDDKALAERVRNRRANRRPQSKKASRSSSGYDPYVESPQQKAQEAYRLARSDFNDSIEVKLGPKLRAIPGAASICELIKETKLYQGCRSYNGGRKNIATINSPAMSRYLNFIKAPSFEAVLELENSFDPKRAPLDWVGMYGDEGAAMTLKLAEVLGVEVGEAPKLADFMPKKEPKAPAAKKAAKAKPAKKAAKK